MKKKQNFVNISPFQLNPWANFFGSSWDDMVVLPQEIERAVLPAHQSGDGLNRKETKKSYTICVNMPGFDSENIAVEVDHDNLIVSGNMEKEECNLSGESIEERSFYQTIALPADANTDKIKCKYKHGVLIIHVPKKSTTRKLQLVKIEVVD